MYHGYGTGNDLHVSALLKATHLAAPLGYLSEAQLREYIHALSVFAVGCTLCAKYARHMCTLLHNTIGKNGLQMTRPVHSQKGKQNYIDNEL